MVRSNPARRRPKKRPTYGDNTNNQQTEARQENGGDEVTRYLPLIQQLKAFPAISSDVGEDLHVDEPMLAQTISLNSTINGLNNMEIGDGDGITIPQPLISRLPGKTIFARSTTGFGLRLSPGSPAADDSPEGISSTSQPDCGAGVAAKLECQHPASETHTRIIYDSVTVP
ncbi:hypothetical protein NC653_020545 [Populus alba x Populus x berolinensis]|uniref:Uncharacterized protein n=1 Tax=Populus alba x Populus x berolinensis TaxID=444605 RepID=A0AAD6MMI0_9ROSI|nr:hypothetical protein NC653_020545 [Populus alba x Populus x berolinensis]